MAESFAIGELYPDPDAGAEGMLVAVVATQVDALHAWLSGEVHQRGFTPAWDRKMARWLVERAGLVYRDPVAPPPEGTGPAWPTTGQLWPR